MPGPLRRAPEARASLYFAKASSRPTLGSDIGRPGLYADVAELIRSGNLPCLRPSSPVVQAPGLYSLEGLLRGTTVPSYADWPDRGRVSSANLGFTPEGLGR